MRVHNTNTKKIIYSRFTLDEGLSAVDGDLAIPGVSGTGSPVRLEFREPGGATTGKLLPTGNVVDTLDVPGVGKVRASMVDAANACVFVNAADLGLTGTEMPEAIDNSPELLKKLGEIRIAASIAMGIGKDREGAMAKRVVPFVGFVSGPQGAKLLSGDEVTADAIDVTGRMLSNGQAHRALPLTASLCMAVAARLKGSVVYEATRPTDDPASEIRIAMPSGILTVAADVKEVNGQWHAEQGAFFRTQRRLFEGYVCVRAARVPAAAKALGGKKHSLAA